MRAAASGALLWFLGALAGNETAAATRVLFIGNSLTATNDLPAIVQALAKSRDQTLDYQTLAYPNYSLGDHWDKGEAQAAIAKGRWDFVVLQQGPSALQESREMLLKYTQLFTNEIQRVGARPALYMVWPSAGRRDDFDRVSESYRLAALKVGGILVPVGAALREAEKQQTGMSLFAADGFHPSAIGSYLAALVFYERLFQQSPVGLPARLHAIRPRLKLIPDNKRVALLSIATRHRRNRDGRRRE